MIQTDHLLSRLSSTSTLGPFFHISDRCTRFGLSLITDALLTDRWRDPVIHMLQRRIFEKETFNDRRRLRRVQQDKKEMATALLASFTRALERRQVSRNVLYGILHAAFGNYIPGFEDPAAKRSLLEFGRRHAGARPPSFIVVSPTRACNLRCAGCYASSGPVQQSLSFTNFNRMLTEAKELWGVRFFVVSGGEPFVYRSEGKGFLDAAAVHPNCFFLVFTNGTLIDAPLAGRLAEVGNVTVAVSVEGFQTRTDQRRGPGVFTRILDAMDHLRRAGVLFGLSLTATRENAEEILSDAFLDFFFDRCLAVYAWLFQYMPIGRDYSLELLVTPEQRLWMWRRTWEIIRERRIMLADFWNCGTVSEGCIAAGAPGGYLYIDWNGKVMPCVFVPYAAANLNEIYQQGGTLDDVYELPYFRAIRAWQHGYGLGARRPEEHGNWLMPCSFRDHYAMGRSLIERYQAQPQDEAAAAALEDETYCRHLIAYDRALHGALDPVWEQEYASSDSR